MSHFNGWLRCYEAEQFMEEKKVCDKCDRFLVVITAKLNVNVCKMNETMKYFKRLKSHPGLFPATFLTVLIYAAALGNNNLAIESAWIAGSIGACLIWSCVLISNFSRK